MAQPSGSWHASATTPDAKWSERLRCDSRCQFMADEAVHSAAFVHPIIVVILAQRLDIYWHVLGFSRGDALGLPGWPPIEIAFADRDIDRPCASCDRIWRVERLFRSGSGRSVARFADVYASFVLAWRFGGAQMSARLGARASPLTPYLRTSLPPALSSTSARGPISKTSDAHRSGRARCVPCSCGCCGR